MLLNLLYHKRRGVGVCPVLVMRGLNEFLMVLRFQTFSVLSVKAMDAYFHVPACLTTDSFLFLTFKAPAITGYQDASAPGQLTGLCAVRLHAPLNPARLLSVEEHAEQLSEPLLEYILSVPCGRHAPQPSPSSKAVALHPHTLPRWKIDCCLSCCSLWACCHCASAKTADGPSHGRQVAQALKTGVSQQMRFRSVPMKGEGVSVKGCPHGLCPFPSRGFHHRCLPFGAEQDCRGAAGCSGAHGSRRGPGATCCTSLHMHVLVQSDKTSTVFHINRQGGGGANP